MVFLLIPRPVAIASMVVREYPWWRISPVALATIFSRVRILSNGVLLPLRRSDYDSRRARTTSFRDLSRQTLIAGVSQDTGDRNLLVISPTTTPWSSWPLSTTIPAQ